MVQPELLDSLAPDDPAARHNRRDLRLLNALMGNFSWCTRAVARGWRHGAQWLELGPGDGYLGGLLARRWSADTWQLTGIDPWPRPPTWPSPWTWRRANALALGARFFSVDGILVNLLLHQFSDGQLRSLGATWNAPTGPRFLVLNETLRRPLSAWLARAAFVLGLNYVSRHDALVSVRAGFRRGELAPLLGLDPAIWQWQEKETALGALRFTAQRREKFAS